MKWIIYSRIPSYIVNSNIRHSPQNNILPVWFNIITWLHYHIYAELSPIIKVCGVPMPGGLKESWCLMLQGREYAQLTHSNRFMLTNDNNQHNIFQNGVWNKIQPAWWWNGIHFLQTAQLTSAIYGKRNHRIYIIIYIIADKDIFLRI